MTEKERPYNPIITNIGDTFIAGEAPKVETIDLTKKSLSELEDLVGLYPEAGYELVWRIATGADEEAATE